MSNLIQFGDGVAKHKKSPRVDNFHSNDRSSLRIYVFAVRNCPAKTPLKVSHYISLEIKVRLDINNQLIHIDMSCDQLQSKLLALKRAGRRLSNPSPHVLVQHFHRRRVGPYMYLQQQLRLAWSIRSSKQKRELKRALSRLFYGK